MSRASDFTISVDDEPTMEASIAQNAQKQNVLTASGENTFTVTPVGSDQGMTNTIQAGQTTTITSGGPPTTSEHAATVDQGDTSVVGILIDDVNDWTYSAVVTYTEEGAYSVEIDAKMTKGWSGSDLIGDGFIVAAHGEPDVEAEGY